MVRTGLLSHPTLFHSVIDKKLSVRMQPLFTVPILRCPRLLLLDLRQIGLVEAAAGREDKKDRLTGVGRKAILTVVYSRISCILPLEQL